MDGANKQKTFHRISKIAFYDEIGEVENII